MILFLLLAVFSCSSDGEIKQIKESENLETIKKDAGPLPEIIGGYVPEFPTSFSHSTHHKSGLKCANCHRVSNSKIEKEPDVNDCIKCHNLGKIDYSGLTNHEQLEKACGIISTDL